MATRNPLKFANARVGYLVAPLAILGVAGGVLGSRRQSTAPSDNYRLVFTRPAGWMEIPHGPSTLFLYREPRTNLLLRGGINVLEDAINPTPDLDTDALAKQYVQTTKQNMPNWQGRVLDTVDADGARFRLVRRWSPDKCVVSAFCVKGNTTVAITLSGNGGEANQIDATFPAFRTFLSGLALTPETYARR